MTKPIRLNKNQGRYFGEGIEIQKVVRDGLAAARQFGWTIEKLNSIPERELLAFQRPSKPNAKRVYISTGIHGDEPAGPLAILEMLQANQWPEGVAIWLCPCLNPTGFPLNSRENDQGIDLNRDYRDPQTDEIRAHVAWLAKQPEFDLTLCVHEDWEAHGFYLYEVNPEHRASCAEAIIDAVGKNCPIDPSPMIDARPARNGIIRPDLDPSKRPQWPEAFYLITNKTRHGFTLEAPSDFQLAMRVKSLVTAVQTALESIRGDVKEALKKSG